MRLSSFCGHAAHKLRQPKRAKRSGLPVKGKRARGKRAGPLESAHGGATLWEKIKKDTAQRHIRSAPKEPRRAERVGGQDRCGGPRAVSPRERPTKLFARGAPRRLFQHRILLRPGRRHATPRREPPLAGQWPELSWPPLSLFSRFASRADSAARLIALTPSRPGAFGSSQASSMSS